MFEKILVANRGEIAVRIIRACREMGIQTVAVCSEVDKDALHAQLADECVCIGSYKSKDSYLNIEKILSAAIATKADAIHPGFGFLSENSKFAKICNECNIEFIGPSVESMINMGNKSIARQTMIKAGVPVVPGTNEPLTDAYQGKKIADEIGYPVIVKAVSGGGGKGMREVRKSEDFVKLFETAKKETKIAFGDDQMYIEKFVENARHIEFQIIGDKFGNVLQLGERDCSIQRRHQKLVEETPSVVLKEEVRKKMGEAAIKAAKAAKYYSAGTIEFLLDKDGEHFYFMEMNTRIQVEHPVTEMVTGVDLIKEMIMVAAGEKLTMTQNDVKHSGCAIECRINAEDPDNHFIPCPGTVNELHFPGGNGIRVDSALFHGYKIPSCYDSMVAKIIVHGHDRKEAIEKMRSALGEVVIDGIKTNLDLQYEIINSNEFAKGNALEINRRLDDRG